MPLNILDLSHEELDTLIARLEEAIEHELALTPADNQLLLSALLTLANIQDKLQEKSVTVTKLKKLLGLIRSSEKLRDILPQSKSDTDDSKAKNKKRKPKNNASTSTVKPSVEHHPLTEYKKGDPCPECQS